ncbi:pancreatic triacylglycerol lipase-like [Leguminivora glycinivorella]|uniref:pancreatic triacylglycerol lipase-like n=1 Tax=Leguminivora glycinivorella TaxID=1035111 RepID=UPI00200CF839|nr:pancreatic triacylglycerol lipase-like [Leguminivora glycinivorella]
MYIKCALVLCAAVAAHGFNLGPLDVEFHLYTRSNPSVSQPVTPSVNSFLTSTFSPARRTFLTIHSDGEGVGGNFNAFVVGGLLTAADVNVIAVDWSRASFLYSLGLANAPQAGEMIAEIINVLIVNFGYSADMVTIVGVGLGGHLAGITARHITGNVGHIVAIDPSFYGWTHHPDILKATDATAVEVLHATSGILGYDYPLGTIDFYPNGGVYQNGCGTDASCSHIYAYAFYAESLAAELNSNTNNQFVGTACDSYEQAIANICSGARDVTFGGTAVKTSQSGIYTFNTNAVQPFAQG